MINTKLKDKVVLVTGANNPHGIGAATARACAAEGAKVFVTYLRLSPEEYGVSHKEAQQADSPGLPFYYALQAQPAAENVWTCGRAGEQRRIQQVARDDFQHFCRDH